MATHLRPNHADGIAEIRYAFALLATIDEVLRRFAAQGRPVDVFRKQLDGWARVPLSISAGWTSNVQPDHLISEVTLQQIESLSAFLDGKVLVLEDAQRLNLRDLIDQADRLLTAEDLDPLLQGYLRRLIAAIRYALDDEAAGRAFNFAEAVERLWVAFNAAAERASQERKAGWRDLVRQITIGVTAGGVVEGASIALQIATLS